MHSTVVRNLGSELEFRNREVKLRVRSSGDAYEFASPNYLDFKGLRPEIFRLKNPLIDVQPSESRPPEHRSVCATDESHGVVPIPLKTARDCIRRPYDA